MSGEHRQTAADWHGSQWSPLYAYASTGTVRAGLDREIRGCLDIVERGHLPSGVDPVHEYERLSAFLRDIEPVLKIDQAREIGAEHGQTAATWWQQDALGGRATGDTAAKARRILQGIEDGDPAVLDAMPTESTGYSDSVLLEECERREPDLDDREAHKRWRTVLPDLRDAYQSSFRDAVIDACGHEVGEWPEQVSVRDDRVQRQEQGETTQAVLDRIDRLIADEGPRRDERLEL